MKLAVVLLLSLAGEAAAEQCWADWRCKGPQCAKVMGAWSGSAGPRDRAGCEAWRRANFHGATCRCTAGGSSGSSGGGGGLQEQAVGHMVDGMMKGNIQQFNMGAAGLIGAGLGEMLRGDPAAAARAEAARQAAAAEAARQEALRKKRFENNKQELLRQMDDGASVEGRFAFKEDDLPAALEPAQKAAPPPGDCSRATIGEPLLTLPIDEFKSLVSDNLWQKADWDTRPLPDIKGPRPAKSFDDAADILSHELRDAGNRTVPVSWSDAPLRTLAEEYGLKEKLSDLAKDQATDVLLNHKDYEEFLRNTRKCLGRKDPDDFNKCLDSVSFAYNKVLEKIGVKGIEKALQARDVIEDGTTKAIQESVRQINNDICHLSR